MNLRNSASLEAASVLSEPFTIGTDPLSTHCLISASVRTPLAKNALAASFCCAVALEEIDRYWPGLPTVLLGSPLPPSTGGKFIQPRSPPLTKSPPSFDMDP